MANEFNDPQSRNEAILQNILGADNPLGEPQSRIEALLMQLLEKETDFPVLPTTAGDYVLKVTVDGDVPSYEWVIIEAR